jgi:hypothetical protein
VPFFGEPGGNLSGSQSCPDYRTRQPKMALPLFDAQSGGFTGSLSSFRITEQLPGNRHIRA